MADRFHAFDCKDVQVDTRRHIAFHSGMLVGVALLTLGSILLISGRTRYPTSWSLFAGLLGLAPIGYLGYRVHRLSHVVWLVKIYADRIEGYDYARRKMAIPWDRLRRIDFRADHSLVLVGREGTTIRLPSEFGDYSDVAHALLARCGPSHEAIHVDGRPLERMKVAHLFRQTEGDEPAAF